MLDEDSLKETFAHAMSLWFEPEIKRRQEMGTAPKPYPLRGAQVILYADGRLNCVRLNEEVQTRVLMKFKDGLSKVPGEMIHLNDIEEIQEIRLPPSADANCGHFTLIRLGEYWYGAFDSRYNKGKASELLAAAEEFLATGSLALSAGRKRVAIDNLFSAAELAAKACVITIPVPGDRDHKKHTHILRRFNMFGHGNVEGGHLATFKALSKHRPNARYVHGRILPTKEDISKWEADVVGLLQDVRSRIA